MFWRLEDSNLELVSCQFRQRFDLFFDDFLLRSGSKNIVKYIVFVLFASRHYILQHGENCANTSVFARHWTKNTENTLIFATKCQKKIVNTVVLSFRSAKKISAFTVFFAPRVSKYAKPLPI